MAMESFSIFVWIHLEGHGHFDGVVNVHTAANVNKGFGLGLGYHWRENVVMVSDLILII